MKDRKKPKPSNIITNFSEHDFISFCSSRTTISPDWSPRELVFFDEKGNEIKRPKLEKTKCIELKSMKMAM